LPVCRRNGEKTIMDARFVALGAAIATLAHAPAMADQATKGLGPLVQVSKDSPFGPLDACGNFPGEFFGIGVNFRPVW
jgi:hypothetical protein